MDKILVINPNSTEAVTRGTLHWLCAGILRNHAAGVGLKPGFGIADEAYQLSVLVHPPHESSIRDVIFRVTTTLGMRRRELTRWALERSELTVDIEGSKIRVKVGLLHGEVVNVAPEFEDCVRAAENAGIPAKDVYAEAVEGDADEGDA